jgi:hypothetical protein
VAGAFGAFGMAGAFAITTSISFMVEKNILNLYSFNLSEKQLFQV